MPYLTPDDSGGIYLCRRIRFRAELASAITGALEILSKSFAWEAFGDLSPDDTADMALEALNYYLDSGDACLIGTICHYLTVEPPDGVIACDGSTYNRSDYPDLYDKIDPLYIVDADTFVLPKLNGRTLIAQGDDAPDQPTEFFFGDKMGAFSVNLTEAQLPEHAHGVLSPIGDILVLGPGEIPVALPSVASYTDYVGQFDSVPIMQPTFVCRIGLWAR